jgi:hypothetical protein
MRKELEQFAETLKRLNIQPPECVSFEVRNADLAAYEVPEPFHNMPVVQFTSKAGIKFNLINKNYLL